MESGHETTTYGKQGPDRLSVIAQIFEDHERSSPTSAVRGKLQGDQLSIYYISYEMFLPTKIRQVDETADGAIKEMVKYLKKEYRARAHEKIDLKEDKEAEARNIEKVSMNERYMYVKRKVFDVS